MSTLKFCFAFLLLATTFAADAAAQTLYGSLLGNVTDPSGAALPAARVQARNTATGLTRETTTSDRGAYVFSDLQPGTYDLTVNAQGFGAFVQTGITVSTN